MCTLPQLRQACPAMVTADLPHDGVAHLPGEAPAFPGGRRPAPAVTAVGPYLPQCAGYAAGRDAGPIAVTRDHVSRRELVLSTADRVLPAWRGGRGMAAQTPAL